VVAGDSAGANLAAVAALREPQLVAGQLLIYPALDATLSGDSYTEFSEYGLSRADMQAAYRGYLGDADPRDPEVSPLLAGDLSSAPPAWVVVASHDVLRDDGMRYVARLREAGVAAELTIAEGLVHGFIRWGGAVTAANAALDAGAEFVRRATVN
jgi:acetyl esterase